MGISRAVRGFTKDNGNLFNSKKFRHIEEKLSRGTPADIDGFLSSLERRLHHPSLTVSLKAHHILHLILDSNLPKNNLLALCRRSFIPVRNSQCQQARVLSAYSAYISTRLMHMSKLGFDCIREKLENRTLVDVPATAATFGKLLAQTSCVMAQCQAILDCMLTPQLVESSPLYQSVYGVLVTDLALLFQWITMALVSCLQSFFSLSHEDSEQTLYFYKEFTQLQFHDEISAFAELGKHSLTGTRAFELPQSLQQSPDIVRQLTKALEAYLYERGNDLFPYSQQTEHADEYANEPAQFTPPAPPNSHRRHSSHYSSDDGAQLREQLVLPGTRQSYATSFYSEHSNAVGSADYFPPTPIPDYPDSFPVVSPVKVAQTSANPKDAEFNFINDTIYEVAGESCDFNQYQSGKSNSANPEPQAEQTEPPVPAISPKRNRSIAKHGLAREPSTTQSSKSVTSATTTTTFLSARSQAEQYGGLCKRESKCDTVGTQRTRTTVASSRFSWSNTLEANVSTSPQNFSANISASWSMSTPPESPIATGEDSSEWANLFDSFNTDSPDITFDEAKFQSTKFIADNIDVEDDTDTKSLSKRKWGLRKSIKRIGASANERRNQILHD